MNFKQAIEEMKKGKKVRRKGWKDVWFTLDNGGSVLRTIPNMYKGTIKGTITGLEPLTLESAENVCADDWEVIEDKKQWWKPELDEKYYIICSDGSIDFNTYDGDFCDKSFMAIGNCFQTEEQAKFMVEKLKIIHELKTFAVENNEEEIDWNNKDQRKYYLILTCTGGKNRYMDATYTFELRSIPFNVYFTSEKLAKKAIETIGEERLKKYYFGVEDE